MKNLWLASLLVAFLASTGAEAKTGLPLPRFVSIKGKEVNARVGPGTQYPVTTIYTSPGTPVKIVAEYDHWRRIEDADGTLSWVFHSMLQGTRHALVTSDMVALRKYGNENAEVKAKLGEGVTVQLHHCDAGWCEATFTPPDQKGKVKLLAKTIKGWLPRASLWGALEGEVF